jgi:hypothetical protein
MSRLVVLTLVFAMILIAAPPARAEHMTFAGGPEAPAPDGDRTLDVQVRVGKDGFRMGGRLLGGVGVPGAWLNGQLRRDGFAIDGRVQNDKGRAYNFKFDAALDDLLPRAAWQWLLRPIASPFTE